MPYVPNSNTSLGFYTGFGDSFSPFLELEPVAIGTMAGPRQPVGRSSPSFRPNPTSSLYFSPHIGLLAATTCSSLPFDTRLPTWPACAWLLTSNLRFVSTLDPSSGGQPALGARNTTLVLRQYVPALNFSLELSRTRRPRRWIMRAGLSSLWSSFRARSAAGFCSFLPGLEIYRHKTEPKQS